MLPWPAKANPKEAGWPEGWAAARAVVRSARQADQAEFQQKYQALADKLAPSSLTERITSYVLPEQWGDLDVADIDFNDEKRYAKAQQQVADICASIGEELANDLTKLEKHLPSMLEANTTRPLIVAEAIGGNAGEPRYAWQIIISKILSADQRYIYNFAGSFLKGLASKDKKLAEDLLEEALQNIELHKYFVQMQNMVGLNDVGVSRLVKAAALDSVPIGTFRNLAGGRALDDLSGLQIQELISAISGREGGVAVAIEVLHMHYYSRRSEKVELTEAEANVGRNLLSLVTFENRYEKIGHALGDVAAQCLRNPEDNEIAVQLCIRLNNSIAAYKVSAGDYSDFLAAIAKIFPEILLDVFLDDEDGVDPEERRRTIFDDFRSYRPDPLQHIADDVMLTWANKKPASRFIFLAAGIRPWQRPGGIQPNENLDETPGALEFTSLAYRLIREAPDPAAVVRVLIRGFYPMGWSGSLASILESRLPLLQALLSEANDEVVEEAKKALPKLQLAVDRQRQSEAKESRDRDERFEW